MGLWDAIKSVGQALGIGDGKTYAPVTAQSLISGASQKEYAVAHPVASKVIGGTALAGAGLAVGAVATGATITATATKVATTIVKTAVKAVKAHPIATPLVATAGYGIIKEVGVGGVTGLASDTASSVANLSGNVAQLAINPSLENLKDIYTENPLLATGATALGVLALGKGALVSAAAVKTLTGGEKEIVLDTGNNVLATTKQTDTGLTDSPLSPVTTSVTTGQKRRKYKAKKVVTPSIRQNVVVQVSNRAVGTTTKNYLKRENVLYA